MMRFLRRKQATVVNPLAHLSNDELVAEHHKSGVNSHFLTEMTRRLMRSNERLSTWLLVFTVAIFLLTAVLVWVTLKPSLVAARSWVLWQQTRLSGPPAIDHWDIQEVFETKETCERAKAPTSPATRDICYPDTVDPRGGKGK